MRRFSAALPLVLSFACLSGCRSDTLRVTSVQVGRSVNADSTVANHTTQFGPNDTVYVSVLTAGAGSGIISLRWMYGERIVGEPRKEVSYRDVAATEFQLRSAAGFPPGDYTVEVFLDGQPAGTREFKVEKPR